jgi:adenine C2-methylase RlmN of 23S rRNA A2503 and tRNA A37
MKNSVLESKEFPIKKIHFGNNERQYYTVSFYDNEDNSINICASSQIGCLERCLFCATGDSPFVRNLTASEISEQYAAGISVMADKVGLNDPRLLYIIMEGMGEPSFNLQNCFNGLSDAFKKGTLSKFDEVQYRISTAGNPGMIQPYKDFIGGSATEMPSVNFQFQISLHSPFDSERAYLIPGIGAKFALKDTLPRFSDLANSLGQKLKLNYLLLNFPNGQNNYSSKHAEELARILNPAEARIKLTKYSNTGKKFSSPNDETYLEFKKKLEGFGFGVVIRELFGEDISAACGMLHYEQQ